MARPHKQESIFINIRVKQRQRDLIDQAFFTVDSETFKKIQILQDHPLPATARLRRILKIKAPWSK